MLGWLSHSQRPQRLRSISGLVSNGFTHNFIVSFIHSFTFSVYGICYVPAIAHIRIVSETYISSSFLPIAQLLIPANNGGQTLQRFIFITEPTSIISKLKLLYWWWNVLTRNEWCQTNCINSYCSVSIMLYLPWLF